jgi:hypothetical protein
LSQRLQEARQLATKNLIQSKQRNKHYYDAKAKTFHYEPGDSVYVLKETWKIKLDQIYVGPYVISNILDHYNVILEDHNGKRIIKHIDKIKPAYDQEESDE